MIEESSSTLPPPWPAADGPTVVILAEDLFFSTRLVDVIQARGGTPVLTESGEAFTRAVDRTFPVLALVDLKSATDWATAIRRCKMRPHTAQTPIYAFGSHVEVETLQAARRAGADHAWARSRFMEELVQVVDRHVNPPLRYPEGWDDPLAADAWEGVRLFNAGEYYEQHELLEQAWLAESRPVREVYQGILQVGVAFLQMQRGNWQGAIKMFRRGLPKLRALPPVVQGLDVHTFYREAAALHRRLSALGPSGLAEMDLAALPRLHQVPDSQTDS